MPPRSATLLLLLGVLACASGCLHLQQAIELKANNTGTFELYLSLPVDYYESFIADQDSPYQSAYGWIFDPQQAGTVYQNVPGFTLRQYRVFELEDRIYVQIQGQMRDATAALAHPALGRFTVSYRDDRVDLTRDLAEPEQQTAAQRADWNQLTRGMKLRLAIKGPKTLASTSAPAREGNNAVWAFTSDSILNSTTISATWK